VVLSRVSLRPGDLIDTREVRNSERRLKASQLFAGTQNDGEPPRIVVRPPDLNSLGGLVAASPPRQTVRGQEPEVSRAVQPGQPCSAPQDTAIRPPCIYSWNGPLGRALPAAPAANPAWPAPTGQMTPIPPPYFR
jgi:hypothetical protein